MKRLTVLVALLAAASACTTKFIGDTQIEDTDENREVLRVVEQYRRAMEDEDLGRVLELTSDSFFEDPGTPHDPKDDYDKAGLKKRLEEAFASTVEQRLEMNVRRLELDEEARKAKVDYLFDHRFRLKLAAEGAGDGEWHRKSDVSRAQLVREGESWKIVSGI